MAGITGAHLVALSALLFSACSALTLIYVVNHFDPPEPKTESREHDEVQRVA